MSCVVKGAPSDQDAAGPHDAADADECGEGRSTIVSRSFREPPAAADVEVSMSNILLLVLGLASAEFLGQAPHQPTPHEAAPHYRYFKEHHVTGAQYLWLRDNGDYTIVTRECMGIFQVEGGRWTKQGPRLKFTPTRKSGGRPLKAYAATEVRHGKHTFLAMEPDDPALTIPAAETLKELKAAPDALPLYVFFETDRPHTRAKMTSPIHSASPVQNSSGSAASRVPHSFQRSTSRAQ